MPRAKVPKCNIGEFDIGMYCRRNSVDNSYIDEVYYENGDLAGVRRLLIPLCKSHYGYINRAEELYNLEYEDWVEYDASV
jgi:hypothetical protein